MKRCKQLNIKLTENELNELKNLVSQDETLSSFVRELLIYRYRKVLKEIEEYKLLIEEYKNLLKHKS